MLAVGCRPGVLHVQRKVVEALQAARWEGQQSAAELNWLTFAV